MTEDLSDANYRIRQIFVELTFSPGRRTSESPLMTLWPERCWSRTVVRPQLSPALWQSDDVIVAQRHCADPRQGASEQRNAVIQRDARHGEDVTLPC
jgi:hypothetical protein